MKAAKSVTFAMVAFLIFTGFVFAESPQNRDAVNWYNKALKEKKPELQIEALAKAIKADPNFGQAYFQIAIAYKKLRQFDKAEQNLKMAMQTKRGRDWRKIQFNSAFELARIYKSQRNYAQAVQYYQKARENVRNKSIESTLVFELATCYFRLENFDAATAEAQAGIKNSSDKKIYFQNFLQAVESARRISANYVRAKKIMDENSLLEAKILLSDIEKKSPGYKDVDQLLAQIDIRLQKKESNEILSTLYDKGLHFEKENKIELAIATFEQIISRDKTFKDASSRMQNLERLIARKNKEGAIKRTYDEGISAIQSREWTQAIIAFERVVKSDANYLDAAKKLKQAKTGLNKENQSTIIQRFYDNGKQAMFARNWGAALVALEKVKNIDSHYRDVQSLLMEVEERISSNTNENNSVDLKTASLLDSLYTEAQGFIQIEDWFQSVSLLEKIQIIKPGYRDVIDLLATSRTNLALSNNDIQNSIAKKNNEDSTMFFGGLFLTLLFVPLMGYVVLVPQARARAFTLIGKHHLAANIYEHLLQQNPGKLKLYPPLANAYLLNGRRDQKALELFSTILKLNLNIPNRKKLEQIIQNKYLVKGSASSDAISALHSASKSSHSH